MRGARAVLLVLFACAVGSATLAEGQIVSPVHIMPVVAKVAGAAGTDWMTSMSLSNVSDGAVDVSAMFFRENTDNTPFFGPSHDFSLTAGQTMTVNDVLGSWFPGQGNTKGMLLLLAEPGAGNSAPDASIAATARIFNNANPNATYGQAVSSGLFSFIFGRGVSVMPGARWDGRTRSNVGVVNLGAQPINIVATTYGANGAMVAEASKQVRAFSIAQWSLQQLGVSNLSTPGRVEVTLDPGDITWDPCDPSTQGAGGPFGVFMAYISRVDQATGDAEFAMGQTDWTQFVLDCGSVPDDCLKRAPLSGF